MCADPAPIALRPAGIRAALLSCLYLAAFVLPGPVLSQEDPRAFGEPRYWLNSGPNQRLPIRERALVWYDGIDGPRVPAPTRSGWTPRLSFVLESRDKTQGLDATDTIATLTPGLSFVRREDRWVLDADLTFNLSKHFDQEQLSYKDPNVLAEANFGYALSPRDALWAFAGYTRLRDTGNVLEGALLPENTVVGTRALSATWQREIRADRGFSLEYANAFRDINQPTEPDITSNGVTATYTAFLTPTDRIETILNAEQSEFENRGQDSAGALFARYTRDMGERLTLSGEAGVLRTTAGGGQTFPKIGGALVGTFGNAKLALELDRNIFPVPGLSGLNLTDRVAASAHLRVTRGTQVQFLAEHLLLDQLAPGLADIRSSTFELSLSHAINRQTWLWGRIRETRGTSGPLRERDTRFYLGVSRSFN